MQPRPQITSVADLFGARSSSIFVVCFTVANATPINVRTSALTDTFAVVTWDLPSTAMGKDIVLNNYMANFVIHGNGGSYSPSVSKSIQAILLNNSIDGVEPGRRITVTVTANYVNPPDDATSGPAFEFIIPMAGNGKGSIDIYNS